MSAGESASACADGATGTTCEQACPGSQWLLRRGALSRCAWLKVCRQWDGRGKGTYLWGNILEHVEAPAPPAPSHTRSRRNTTSPASFNPPQPTPPPAPYSACTVRMTRAELCLPVRRIDSKASRWPQPCIRDALVTYARACCAVQPVPPGRIDCIAGTAYRQRRGPACGAPASADLHRRRRQP